MEQQEKNERNKMKMMNNELKKFEKEVFKNFRSKKNKNTLLFHQYFCSICLVPFNPNEKILTTQCDHMYHKECLVEQCSEDMKKVFDAIPRTEGPAAVYGRLEAESPLCVNCNHRLIEPIGKYDRVSAIEVPDNNKESPEPTEASPTKEPVTAAGGLQKMLT